MAASFVLAAAVVMAAFADRPNFYSAMVSISQNSASMFILVNMVLIFVLLFGQFLQQVFFGELRALELEHLYERTWYAVMETFLAMTIFHDEFTFQFALMFSVLTFLRVFHWISADRVNLVFQTAQPPTLLSMGRLCFALGALGIADMGVFLYCGSEVLDQGPGVMVMFAFEFAVLANSLVNSVGKFIVNFIESRYLLLNEEEDTWEPKGTYIFFIEVVSDTIRLSAYVTLFIFMLEPYGVPLHILRDVYMTSVSLISRLRDFSRFRTVRARMDQQIANASLEDFEQDAVCIICREEMTIDPNQPARYVPKKLACGHVIHHGCLKSWLERSQRCPTCRRSVVEEGGTADAAVGLPGNIHVGVNVPQVDVPHANILAADAAVVPDYSQDQTRLVVSHGAAMPPGWSAYLVREVDGVKQVKLDNGVWVDMDYPAGSPVAATAAND